jgi:hypothetical protein
MANFTIYRGDDARLTGTVLDVDSAAVDISGWTFKLSTTVTKGDAVVWSVTGEIISSSGGTFQVDLTPTQTATVCSLYYDVQATTAAGKIYTLTEGRLTFSQDITP